MKITRKCPMCGSINEQELDITTEQMFSFLNGFGYIQDIFPNLSATEREYIKTGYCFDCQEKLFALFNSAE